MDTRATLPWAKYVCQWAFLPQPLSLQSLKTGDKIQISGRKEGRKEDITTAFSVSLPFCCIVFVPSHSRLHNDDKKRLGRCNKPTMQ